MKRLAVLMLLFGLGFIAANAQTYSIDWYTIDGGGGTSTGGVYSVSGTIGQSDAGHMSGGSYTLDGGFWVIAAVQTPGSPALRIVLTGTNAVVIAWPAPSTGFTLQQNSDLSTSNWSSTGLPSPVVVGSEEQVIVTPPLGNRYYRLVH